MTEEQTLLSAAAKPSDEAGAEVESKVEIKEGAGEEQAQDWRPEALRGENALAKYKSQEDALKALVEAQKLIGRKADGLVVPGEGATPEEIAAFQTKLREIRGVPDKAEAYAVTPPDGAPEGYTLDSNLVGAFQAVALKAGITPTEFKEFADEFMRLDIEGINKSRQEYKAYLEGQEKALVKEWQGQGLVPKDMFNQAVKAARALGMLGKGEGQDILGKWGNHAPLVKALAENVYPLIAEGKLKGGGTEHGGPKYTPREAFDKLRAMQADPRYRDPRQRDPDYVREVGAFAEAHGDLISGVTSRP